MAVVRQGIATETEIRHHWSISRVADWYDLLLYERECEVLSAERAERARESDGR